MDWRRHRSVPMFLRTQIWKTLGLSQPSCSAEWLKMNRMGSSRGGQSDLVPHDLLVGQPRLLAPLVGGLFGVHQHLGTSLATVYGEVPLVGLLGDGCRRRCRPAGC